VGSIGRVVSAPFQLKARDPVLELNDPPPRKFGAPEVPHREGPFAPEMLLQQLRQMLNRQGMNAALHLPDGIHSGLRREKCNGMFFYFRRSRFRVGVDRDRAKALLPFLTQPIGKSVAARLKAARADWSNDADDRRLLDQLERLQTDYAKTDHETGAAAVTREDLHLVCFEFLSS
jgi:hypothetical protein